MATDQVEQSGAVSPQRGVIWITDGVIGDGGPPTNGNGSGYGVTLISGSGAGYGLNDAPVTGPYHQMLLGVGTNGHGFLSWQNFSSATATPFDLIINGTTISIGGANWVSGLLDTIGSAQGDILYRGPSAWTALTPGNSGQVLASGGANANPSWITASGIGTVQSIVAGPGLSGGTITQSGTIALASPVPVSLGGIGVASILANAVVLGNGSGPLSASSIGSIGYVLSSNGTAGPPTWIAAAGTGTMTSVSTANGIKGGPITTSGTIQLDPTTAIQATVNILSSSGTYTIPIVNGVRAQTLFVKMRGGGAGGGGAGTNQTPGSVGVGTSFALIVANGGSGGGPNSLSSVYLGGQGGVGGVNGTGGALQRIAGSPGQNGATSTASNGNFAGGNGGGEGAGLGGIPDNTPSSHNGSDAISATGGGGGGAAANSTTYGSAGGGGQGEYVELLLSSGSSITYPYVVGAGGSGGAGSLATGGAGGSGWIRVEARWQ